MSEKEKMVKGLLYNAGDSTLSSERLLCRGKLDEINSTTIGENVQGIFNTLIKSSDMKAFCQPPFYCDYGYNIHVGENFFTNFNSVFLDVCPITIGDNCMFGPDVKLYTATHPIDPTERNSGLELGKPITIGNNVWLGGSVSVLPGVTIGDNVVAATGTIIIKDVPNNVVVAGNPAKIIKQID